MHQMNSFFTKLITSGQFTIDENGHATLFGEYVILFPSKIIFELIETLEKELGYEKTQKILLHVSEVQVNEAYKRYINRLGINNIDKREIADFTIDILNILGWGHITPKKISYKDKTFEFVSKDTVMPLRFKERNNPPSKMPVDTYLLGIIKRIYECVFETELEAKETECVAMGDKQCVFVGKPKI